VLPSLVAVAGFVQSHSAGHVTGWYDFHHCTGLEMDSQKPCLFSSAAIRERNQGTRGIPQGGSLVLFAQHGEEWLGIPAVFA
jgi:hypothetical protein